ncbi:transcriptional regulator [Verrucosispora sp. WMMA2044]|uniref:transcriptional regulator n=1 Tax=Verrucosispora sp. WMMA2044 TaxID=3016419 RepID=UPI00248CDADF|nr:transcriptional regulator [Verrucosispora sp. WMMA2044]WBB46528.1 transcriptional regulator [Verrucosispora sp. WMMA2044]
MSGVPVPAEVVQVARKRLTAAAEEFDRSRISALVVELAEEWGVVRLWDDVCVPVLTARSGCTPARIAVEHALSEGVRVGLDVFRREPAAGLPTDGVLLAGVEQEEHCLGLHALAAGLRERGRGCLLVGPALPWTALASAVDRARPHTVAVWSQSPVTGRSYRIGRFAREFPAVRVYAAGPGWVDPLTPPVTRLDSLSAAVAVM